jgi:hypothetical protein
MFLTKALPTPTPAKRTLRDKWDRFTFWFALTLLIVLLTFPFLFAIIIDKNMVEGIILEAIWIPLVVWWWRGMTK